MRELLWLGATVCGLALLYVRGPCRPVPRPPPLPLPLPPPAPFAFLDTLKSSLLIFLDFLLLLFSCPPGDPQFLSEVLAFCRLTAAWLLDTMAGGGGGGSGGSVPAGSAAGAAAAGALALPLPEPAPAAFATLPEYFIEDLAEILLHVSRYHPQLLASARLDEVMIFMVVAMASPRHVKSPYLRSKLSEVLHAWLPPAEQDGGSGRRGPQRPSAVGQSLMHLFTGSPIITSQLAPTLLQVRRAPSLGGGGPVAAAAAQMPLDASSPTPPTTTTATALAANLYPPLPHHRRHHHPHRYQSPSPSPSLFLSSPSFFFLLLPLSFFSFFVLSSPPFFFLLPLGRRRHHEAVLGH